jgi:4-amino-4-deoxy-L-arabinose transferase-like glycosyltransferase
MGRRLGGERGGVLSLLFLALTPVFYGHSFYNAKDIPFAALYALAVAGILACDDWPRVRWGRVVGAGILVGLAAAVRVGGLVLFGYALALWLALLLLRSGAPASWPSRSDVLRLAAAWGAAVAAGWTAMVAFWPWAMLDPLRNPFRAWGRFARYWEDMLLYDGRLQR